MNRAQEIVDNLLDDVGGAQDETHLIYLWGEPWLANLTQLTITNKADPDDFVQFETEDELYEYIQDYSVNRDVQSLFNHDYSNLSTKHPGTPYDNPWKPEPDPPEYTLDQKLAHEVFRYGDYVVLKLPTDPEFIRREGYAMQHCLAVAHKDYCDRMQKAEIEVYSLTDMRDNDPKVDIEVALTRSSYGGPAPKPTVTQIRGKRNECPPKDEYLPPLMAFFKSQNWTLSGHGIRNFDAKTDGDLVLARWNQLSK